MGRPGQGTRFARILPQRAEGAKNAARTPSWLHAVLARFPECRVIRCLGLAVAAAPCHLLLAGVLRCVKNFLAGLPRLVQADQAPVSILE